MVIEDDGAWCWFQDERVTLAIGYRAERAGWGIDVAALDLVSGWNEGLHSLVRVTGYAGWVDGWTRTSVPHRTGRGVSIDAIAGVELPRCPTYAARDRYGSTDSDVRTIGLELALGVRFQNENSREIGSRLR